MLLMLSNSTKKLALNLKMQLSGKETGFVYTQIPVRLAALRKEQKRT